MVEMGLPRAEGPEQLGFSAARLERAAAVIRGDVDSGVIPGAVLAIARAGRIAYAEAFGFRDREAKAPMPVDAIFRIASMTKPLTSAAAMMLAEEGRLDIAAPVAQYLPEMADMTVGVERKKTA
ncbi:MAG TPA: serine hydrolase domain-containing protein, partial [Stellaceae bacterium]|nr:serine hydrolase domain-containing protein [Stellaceae bacterium]